MKLIIKLVKLPKQFVSGLFSKEMRIKETRLNEIKEAHYLNYGHLIHIK